MHDFDITFVESVWNNLEKKTREKKKHCWENEFPSDPTGSQVYTHTLSFQIFNKVG